MRGGPCLHLFHRSTPMNQCNCTHTQLNMWGYHWCTPLLLKPGVSNMGDQDFLKLFFFFFTGPDYLYCCSLFPVPHGPSYARASDHERRRTNCDTRTDACSASVESSQFCSGARQAGRSRCLQVISGHEARRARRSRPRDPPLSSAFALCAMPAKYTPRAVSI